MDHLLVKALIDDDNYSWRCDLIHQLFNLHDQHEILSTPLLNSKGHDKAIWKFNLDGDC